MSKILIGWLARNNDFLSVEGEGNQDANKQLYETEPGNKTIPEGSSEI